MPRCLNQNKADRESFASAQIVYQVLTTLEPSPLVPTAHLSPVDIGIGIPMMMVNIEMVFFAMFYHYAYTVGPYKSQPERPRVMGPIRAALQMLNQGELMAGTLFVFTMKKHASEAAVRTGDAHVREPEPEDAPWWKFWHKSSKAEDMDTPLVRDGALEEARRKDSVDSAWSVPIALSDLAQEQQSGHLQSHRPSVIGVAR